MLLDSYQQIAIVRFSPQFLPTILASSGVLKVIASFVTMQPEKLAKT